jgi:hypothetical protein
MHGALERFMAGNTQERCKDSMGVVLQTFKLFLSVFVLVAFSDQLAASEVSQDQQLSSYSGAAVSGLNGSLEFGYLHSDPDTPFLRGDTDGAFTQGALSVPISQQFGFQLDAGVADLDGASTKGVGGHLFWRDPSRGLIGIYSHYLDLDNGFDSTQVGVEAEVYSGPFSLEIFGGRDTLDTPFGDADFFNGEATVGYYMNDNLRLSGGLVHSFDETKGKVGFEMLTGKRRTSSAVFANAEFGNDVTTIMAGIKVYFGNESKSLIRRHREDDPAPKLVNDITNAISCANNIGSQPNLKPKPPQHGGTLNDNRGRTTIIVQQVQIHGFGPPPKKRPNNNLNGCDPIRVLGPARPPNWDQGD